MKRMEIVLILFIIFVYFALTMFGSWKMLRKGNKEESRRKLRNIKFFSCLIVHGKVEGGKINVLLKNLFFLV